MIQVYFGHRLAGRTAACTISADLVVYMSDHITMEAEPIYIAVCFKIREILHTDRYDRFFTVRRQDLGMLKSSSHKASCFSS